MKFIKYTNVWLAISGIVILIGIGGMLNNQRTIGSPLVYGIDFTGGTLMEIQLPEDQTENKTQQVHDVFEAVVPGAINQITVTGKNSYIIQAKDLTETQHQIVKLKIEQAIGSFEEVRFNIIGPKVSETLKEKAIVALIIALIAIVLYIAFAFRKVPKRVSPWRFGFCAIIALVHDTLITVGIFALLKYEVDALFITALLTIMGFSVHDTIVVFDRIRENLKGQTRDETFGDIADASLNQTMARSINTSFSTLITLVALYFLGAESVRVFIFALIIGIFAGTYSSIFIASPILTWWQERKRVR